MPQWICLTCGRIHEENTQIGYERDRCKICNSERTHKKVVMASFDYEQSSYIGGNE